MPKSNSYYANDELSKILEMVHKMQNRPNRTIGEFYSTYLDSCKFHQSENYVRDIKIVFKQFFKYVPKQTPLTEITIQVIQDAFAQMKITAPSGIHNYKRTMRAAFSVAQEWKWIYENPFYLLKLPKKQVLTKPIIFKEEFESIIQGISSNDVRDSTILAYNTGMRIGEIGNLKWNNVDLEKNIITVGDDEYLTKSRKQRQIPFEEKIFNLFQQRLYKYQNSTFIKSKYVFVKANGKPYTTDYISKKFKKACREAGIDERVHFHTLRGSYLSILAMNGAPPTDIQAIAGHSSLVTTMGYISTNLDSLRESVKKFYLSSLTRNQIKSFK